jgi:hypothetical protein
MGRDGSDTTAKIIRQSILKKIVRVRYTKTPTFQTTTIARSRPSKVRRRVMYFIFIITWDIYARTRTKFPNKLNFFIILNCPMKTKEFHKTSRSRVSFVGNDANRLLRENVKVLELFFAKTSGWSAERMILSFTLCS